MERKILLSLAITTYNRRGFLQTAVNGYINQIIKGGLENEVEIVISNDTSPDDTYKYVDELNSKYDFVRGFNQPVNLGVTKNLEWVVNESRGTYVQLCGDDDLMRDGAIASSVRAIKEKSPNFIIVNTSNIHSLDNSNKEYKVVLENRLGIEKDIFVSDLKKDFNLLNGTSDWLYLTNFITAIIFKKDLWQKELETAKKCMQPKNVFLWQAPIVIGISKYGKLLLTAKPFILCRKNPTDNYVNDPRGSYYFNLFESIEISRIVKEYIPSEYKKHKKRYAAFITNSFMVETRKGKNIRKFAWIAFKNYFDIFPENIQFLSMAVAPRLVSKTAPQLRTLKKAIFN